MKKRWYLIFKRYIQLGLFFFTKKITVTGKHHIPKEGAILFAVNHPNGLLDPLVVTTNTPRITHYLVRAAIFKKPIVRKLLATLNLMPIYRIRDGVKELSKNTKIFEDCYDILHRKEALMIFPEGSHDRRRSIRPISKGFTRILFGAMDKYPSLNIQIIPVGVTYQNVGTSPAKVAICFGTPIEANELYNREDLNTSIKQLKDAVAFQLKTLSVHIPLDEHYLKTIESLHHQQVDFTRVNEVNEMLKTGNIVPGKKEKNFGFPFKILFILNNLIPWICWKLIAKKIEEVEFVDTFKFGLTISLFPFFTLLQTYMVVSLFDIEIGGVYFISSLLIALLYTKLSSTPLE